MSMSGKDRNSLQKNLENIRSFNRQRILTLEEERNKMLEEKNELETYLSTLSEELSSLHPFSVLELGLQRLDRICITLLKAADENSRLITENADMKIQSLQNQIKETESEIEKAKAEIQAELNMILRLSGGAANPETTSFVKAVQRDISKTMSSRTKLEQPITDFKDLGTEYGDYLSKKEIAVTTTEGRLESTSEAEAISEEGLKNRIEDTRYRYMIGKVAGEELMDSSGEIIISQNEMITLAHIERAKQEGKLSELIINMIVPGMD